MNHLKSIGLSIALAVAGFAGAASAATVLVLDQSTQHAGNTADVFAAGYGASAPAGTSWDVDPTVSNPPLSVNADYKSPFANTDDEDTTPYYAAGTLNASNGNGTTLTATLTYAAAQRGLVLLWGSIDSYNTIEFFSGVTSLFTFTGAELATLAGLVDPPNYEEVALLAFLGFGPTGFDSVSFSSTQAAFEFGLSPTADPLIPDVAPVPLPAAGLLLAVALGGLVAVRRRRA